MGELIDVMLTIEGQTGGGQVLRTALSLSALTGIPFELQDVRGGRPEPGLKPQHLAAVELMADCCDAELDGAALGATEFSFDPGSLAPEVRTVDLRTAGSVTLLFDAVLPLSSEIEEPFSVTARGGTDVKWSPTVAYLEHVKLPLLARFGYDLTLDVNRMGFYPAGGGEATLTVGRARPVPIELSERGDRGAVTVYSKAAEALAQAEVADRQADRAVERLEAADRRVVENVEYVETRSPGSSLLLRAGYDRSFAGFDALGERGKPAEDVADDAVDALLAFDAGPGAVDRHLADQLLLPLVMSGGRVRAPERTAHLDSNAAVIEQFGFEVRLDEREDGSVLVGAEP